MFLDFLSDYKINKKKPHTLIIEKKSLILLNKLQHKTENNNYKPYFMKKFLLIALMAAGAATAGAQTFADSFSITYDGKPVPNGATIVSHEFVEDIMYQCEVDVAPLSTSQDISVSVLCDFTGTPTRAQMEADKAAWGEPSVCYAPFGKVGACLPLGTSNVAYFTLTKAKDFPVSDGFTIQFHILTLLEESNMNSDGSFKLPTKTSKYHFTLTASVDGKKLSDTFEFDVEMGPENGYDAVESIEAIGDDAPTVYFDLAGRRVLNPAKGQIVIERQGAKVAKRIF